jgi:DNA segregation ATPase FtsK/SpoIIIE, S-DNA-T family
LAVLAADERKPIETENYNFLLVKPACFLRGWLGYILIFAAMANKAKPKKGQATESGKFKAEKDQPLPIKNLVKDERTHKITGAVLILLAFFLFVAFISYLFTWKGDMKVVFNQGLSPLFSSVKTTNLLGNLGAVTAHFFFYYGFGIASFLLCTFFFVAGVNLLFSKKYFSVWRNSKYVIAGLVFFSVTLSFITSGNGFPWGGGFGDNISKFLTQAIGTLGTAALLSVIGLAYIIWRFNPVFKVPKLPERKNVIAEADDEQEDEPGDEEAKLFVETVPANGKGNTLKKGSGIVVLPPRETLNTDPVFELKLTEKPDDENGLDEIPDTKPFVTMPVKPEKKEKRPSGLSLEINEPAKISETTNDTTLEIESERKAAVETDLYEPTLDLRDYKYPSLDLLETHGSEKIIQDPGELETNKNRIIETLKNYDIAIQKISATVGPTVTLYEIVPAAGVRISRIKNLEDDIALSLAALGIRIIAPIPGKGTIGIEVPNVKKTVVSMKTLLNADKFQNSAYSLPIAIGKKIDNENFIVDLTTMPHLLMAGATGQGKSVGLNAILVSLLYKKHPSHLKLVLIDPKKVELSIYRTIEKHFLAKLPGEEDAIITDTKKVIHTLNALCIEMDNRYDLLKEAGARNIKEYNDKFVRRRLNPEKGHQYLPFIVLVIDEFADLIMTAGKEVEMPIARLAQLARAIGIHLIIATQRPSVNIITGTIKANFPARIAFKVSSKIDSRTILDTGGAEQLIGKGDMLISYNGELTRLQCAFVDTPEVEDITNFIGDQRGYTQAFLLPEYVDEKEMEGKDFDLTDRDSLFDDAARLIVQTQSGSTSLLQRRMKLGYNRAGRLMDQLEAAGIVGPNQGSKVRDVLIKTEADLQQQLSALG